MKTNHMKAAWALAGVLGSIALASVPGRAYAACGDGVVDGLDVCDDGNTDAFDGCSPFCTPELGYTCTSQPVIPLVNASFETTINMSSAGWVLARGSIDQVDNSSLCDPPGQGSISVDLNGSTQGEIYQDVSTAIGQRYVMTMLGSANCIEVGGQLCTRTCAKVLTISASDVTTPDAPFTTTTYSLNGNPSSQGWQQVRFEFVATSTSTRLRLTGSDPSFAGPMVDRAAIAESVCVAQTCGNGVLAGGEECDDGNSNSGDGCSSLCTAEIGWSCATPGSPCTAVCGDGVKLPNEGCDDGNTMSGDGCSASCTTEFGYTCTTDLFNLISLCSSMCGDGLIASNEECDDQNSSDGDGCTSFCTVESGYGCTGMPSTCSLLTVCGDGDVDGSEACDDGNTTAGDGCSATCTAESGYTCSTQTAIVLDNGSFELDFPSGNTGWQLLSGSVDRVSSSQDGACWPAGDQSFSVDLNGSTRGQIYQDIPTTVSQRYVVTLLASANCRAQVSDACNLSCTRLLSMSASAPGMETTPTANATYVVAGSPQSGGWAPIRFEFVATSTTTRLVLSGSDPSLAGPMVDRIAIPTSVCVPNACGDGNIGAGETCDDGNNVGGDGCTSNCAVVENGYTCATPNVACTPVCGDGFKLPTEACDDGNTTPGDGCSTSCTVENGFMCLLDLLDVTSICVPTGGDAGVDSGMGTDAGMITDSGMGTDAGMTTDSGMGTDAAMGTDAGMDASDPTMLGGGAAGGAFSCSVTAPRGDEGLVGWSASVLLGLALVARRRRR